VRSYWLIATGEQFRGCVQEAFATITSEMVTNSKLSFATGTVMLANEWWLLSAFPLVVFIFRFIIPFGLCYIFSPVFYGKLTCIRINKVVFRTAICCFIKKNKNRFM
jgi:hypothetical protein